MTSFADTFDTTTVKHLADILADAHRATPEALAEIIEDADWHGTPDTADDQAVGHYVANHLNVANPNRPHLVWVQHHTITVMDLISRAVLAQAEMTGGLADLADLIVEGDPVFAHLHNPAALEIARMTPAERADLADDDFAEFTTDDDPDFFPAITALYESIAA